MFGSMIHRDAERIYRVVLDAMEKTQSRAVFLSGWSAETRSGAIEMLSERPENIFVTEAVPHDWLFPRCKAVIHHGGAGTTAAGLRAGIPNIVIPFAADQPFWGARVQAIGAGPQPIPVGKLTAERLIAALVEAEREDIRKGAQAAGRAIQAEDGVGETVKFIEGYVAQWLGSPLFPKF
jgi:UDP:flavonoid glycosyltransferase YjiC (YdhE family)